MDELCICIGSGLILQLCRTSQVEVVERDALSHWLYAPDGSHNDKHTNKYTHNLHMLVSHTHYLGDNSGKTKMTFLMADT